MKFILLHGDYFIKSYERLDKFITEAKKRNWEIIKGNFQQDLSLIEQLSQSSIFLKERLFVIDEVEKIKKKEFDWIRKNILKLPGTLVILNDGYIPAHILRELPKADKTEEFKLPKIIFTMLDSIYPGNVKRVLTLLHQTLENNPPEFVFALIARLFRDLYWVKVSASIGPSATSSGSSVSTLPAYPSWRVGRLKSQSSKFKEETIKEVINRLAKIDIEVKTSKANLISSLDLLIIKHLE